MNSKRNWTRVTVFVVLALTSLSSIAMTAYTAPVAAPLCGEGSVGHFEQYMAAIQWAEQEGTPVPFALTVSCEEENPNPSASSAGYGGESWARFEQYMAAIEGTAATEPAVNRAATDTVGGSQARFEQYQAAIKWAEQGGTQVPFALTVSYGEESLNPNASHAGYGGESWARFEQYMAAIESTGQ